MRAIPVKQSIEVTRASIQHNEIIFWENKEIMNMVSLIKQYEYKSNKEQAKIYGFRFMEQV